MSVIPTLPNLTLKSKKEFKNENKNENNNNLTQTVIINPISSQIESEDKKKEITPQLSIPEPISTFKDYFLNVLIEYFKDEYVLVNNIVEFSKKIVMREAHLRKLIAILCTDADDSRILIDYDVPDKVSSCCKPIARHILYKQIKSIIIDNKLEFKVFYNQFASQMGNEFNISLGYILTNN
jgi:hypothetical protein